MKTKLISILLALVIFLPSCSDSKGDEPKGCEDEGWLPYESLDVSRSEREIISQQNDFSYNLFKKLYEKPAYQQGNFILSPLSASMSLSMMANGAKGETRDEILDVLGFEDANLEEVNTFNKRLCEELQRFLLPILYGSTRTSRFMRVSFQIIRKHTARRYSTKSSGQKIRGRLSTPGRRTRLTV